MAGYIENTSVPILPISDAQASILDFLFPGFTRISTALQWYFTIDLSTYAPLICFFGLFVFACGRICKYLWGLLETYCTSTVHLRFRDEAYDIVITWISSQSFTKNARSLLATTELASSNRSRNNHSDGGHAEGKTLYYTPWNGRFFMWHKGHLLVFRRQFQAREFSSREEVSISCFGRSPQIIQKLLSECSTEYTKLVQDKTCVYEHEEGTWARSEVAEIRRIETVVFNESVKRELLEHIRDFLNPTSRRWYSIRGIPYRMGYLLYGPPGTGKSSLSKSIAGHFGLDIYILSLSSINEATLKSLFTKLPSRCVMLLEDIDAVSSNRSGDAEHEDSRQTVTGSPSQRNKSIGENISLSTLLNVIDGVASKEGRVLIMTTNYISRLDEALIRPGRVDKKVELGLADKTMTFDLFCLVFKPVAGDVALPEATQSEVLVEEDGNALEAARSQRAEVERLEQLAKEFAAKVPEQKFSPAAILSFLLEHKRSPEEAIDNVEQLIPRLTKTKSESPVVSEDIKPEDTLFETARASKPKTRTEVYHPSVLTKTPPEMAYCGSTISLPASPPDSLSPLSVDAWSDDQKAEMASAIAAMKMAPTLSSHFSSFDTLLGNPPPTPYPCPNCTKSCSQATATDFAQQFLEALKVANAKQEPPPPVKPSSAGHEDKPEESKARASTLEFKKVKEVWDKREYKYKVVESLTPPDEVNELDHYIFVVRTRIDKETKNQIQYVDIKSEGLRDILRKVLQDVQGICLHEEKPSVEQNILYHYLLDLEECRQNPSAALDLSTLEHLDLLLDFIRTAYASTTERLGPLLEKRQITYDLLWTLFKPNTLAHTKCFGTGQPRCVKYEFGEERTANGGIKYFHVKARYLDFDGKVFWETSSEHAIEKFRGAKQITTLEVFPLKYHPSERQVRAHLTECGQKFLSMMDAHLGEYKGNGFYIEKDRVVEIHIESRVVVDAAYFREENPNYARPSITNSDKGSPTGWHVIDFDDVEEVSASAKNNGMDPSEVKGDDLLICSPTVPGFSLDDRRWAEVAVANIKDIDWKQAALDDLHIPPRRKKVVQALSEAHVKRTMTHSFDDVVAGKGQGFSVLLHGPPGVGKTLTAELIAEHLRRPLMPVSAGELGTTAESVEKCLPRIFKRASRWKAVLLLDEADVLLEQRSSHDIHRNALVCVFLRTLEYYQGMMFLTTNRVEQIDDAIASRIHFKLKYDKLNLEQRSNVWRYFLDTATTPQGAAVYSPEVFDDWTRKGRNGREIKNLVSTAQALAIQEGCQVTMSHLEVAIAASEDFECDFKGVGSTEAMNGYV